MAEDLLTHRPQFGKTFTIAMWALGAVAMAQVLAVGLAVLTQPGSYPERQPQAAAGPPAESPPQSPPVASGDNTPAPAAATTGHANVETVAETPGAPPRQPLPAGTYDPFARNSTPPGSLPLPIEAPAAGTPESAAPDSLRSSLPPLPALGNGGLAAAATMTPAAPAPPPNYEAPEAPAIPAAHLTDSLLPAPQFGDPGGREPLAFALSTATLTPHPAHRIDDPTLRGLVASGAELRGSGNMQGALNSLRQAEGALPDHPRVLSEIAATYSEMGLSRRAVLYWEKVRALGPEKGGAYFDLAGMELSGQRLGAAAARTILRIGSVEVTQGEAPAGGERVVLKVTIEAEPGSRPSPGDMAMLVYFYDRVNGEKWEASTADTSQEFVTPPYDWQDGGKEIIEVIYHQPVFSETQKRELGERAYYGYVIELYYRDELQGAVAEPAELKASGDAMPEANPRLFGPENSLFPDPPPPE